MSITNTLILKVFIFFLRGIKPSSLLVPNMWPLLGGHTRRNQTFPLGSSFCSHHGAVSRHMFMLLHHLGTFWVSHKWFTYSVFCNVVMGNNETYWHETFRIKLKAALWYPTRNSVHELLHMNCDIIVNNKVDRIMNTVWYNTGASQNWLLFSNWKDVCFKVTILKYLKEEHKIVQPTYHVW